MTDNIQHIIDQIKHPIIELAGPTPRGYKIVDVLGLKITPTTITNTTKDVTVYTADDKEHSYSVDDVVDVRDLPYKDNSVGILLCSYLPNVDHTQQLSWQDAETLVAKEYDKALNSNNPGTLKYASLHVSLLIGASKVLVDDGILIMQGTHTEDTIFAQSLGLKPLLSERVEQETECQIYFKS